VTKAEYTTYLQSEHWISFKKNLKVLRFFSCEICNSTKKINIHHRSYERMYNENTNDVDILCSECHKNLHTFLKEHKDVTLWDGVEKYKKLLDSFGLLIKKQKKRNINRRTKRSKTSKDKNKKIISGKIMREKLKVGSVLITEIDSKPSILVPPPIISSQGKIIGNNNGYIISRSTEVKTVS